MIDFIVITILITTVHLEFYPIFGGQIYYGSLPECSFRCLSQGGTTTLPTILAADIGWVISSATTAGTATMELPYTFDTTTQKNQVTDV